jgi:hypothetical protein
LELLTDAFIDDVWLDAMSTRENHASPATKSKQESYFSLQNSIQMIPLFS